MKNILPKRPRLKLDPKNYAALRRQVLARDNWRCQVCGSMRNLEVHHLQFRSHSGSDVEQNLVTLCATCHSESHHWRKLQPDGIEGSDVSQCLALEHSVYLE